MTTLSVVIPVRDGEQHVGAMLAGLARNTRPDFEFLLVDDASRDRTRQLVEEHGRRVPGLSLLRHDRPQGAGGARNTGLAASSGRFITYLDGDDWIRPGYLTELVEAIEGLGCRFVMTDHIQVRGTKRAVRRSPEGRRDQVLPSRAGILPHHAPSMVDYPYTWAGVYRRELAKDGLLDFDPRLHTAEDRPWFWRLYREAGTFAVISLLGVFYRRGSPTALTRVGDARQLHFFDAFDLVLAELEGDPDQTLFRRKAVRNYCAILAYHLSVEDRLPPEVRAELRARGRRTLLGFPAETLDDVLRSCDQERRTLFEQALGIT